MKMLSLDLEMEQPSNQIIQIGAIIGDVSTGQVIDKFNAYVQIDTPLSPFITQLTGITDTELAVNGTDLVTAYKKLLAFVAPHQDTTMINPMTWGGGDSQLLKEQVDAAYDKIIVGKTYDWPFGRRWFDVKTLFQFRQMRRGQKLQAGLAKALTKLGLNFKGRKHNALDDALNTFLVAHQLYKEGI